MAYIAKGKILPKFLEKLHELYAEELGLLSHVLIVESTYGQLTKKILQKAYDFGLELNFFCDDLMATLHHFMLEILLQSLQREMAKRPASYKRNLCYSGGLALNIKCNSAIRSSGIFEKIGHPPFKMILEMLSEQHVVKC